MVIRDKNKLETNWLFRGNMSFLSPNLGNQKFFVGSVEMWPLIIITYSYEELIALFNIMKLQYIYFMSSKGIGTFVHI